MSHRRAARALAGVAAMAALTSCVGPAPTVEAYRGKTMVTAEDALSQVQTVRIAVRAAGRGNVTRPYLSLVLSDSEDALSTVADTYGSVQPPRPADDRIRQILGSALQEAEETVAALRIAARRGAPAGQLFRVARPLQHSARRLGRLEQRFS